MYYYIFQPQKSVRDRKIHEKIRALISSYGIAGETAFPTPARTLDDIIQIGVYKGYSTIVTVGSDNFCNRSATVLISQSIKSRKFKTAIGFIPTEKSSLVASMIRTNSLEKSIDILRQRSLVMHDMGLIEPNKFFLLPCFISLMVNKEFEFIAKTYKFSTLASDVIVFNNGKVRVYNRFEEQGLFNKLLGRFVKNHVPAAKVTQIHEETLRINCEQIVSLRMNREIIAKTPITVQYAPRVLKLIVGRDILN